MEIAGFLIGVLGLLFGAYQLRQTRHADWRAEQRLAALHTEVTTISRVVLEPGAEPQTGRAETSELHWAAVEYADVNNDGETELLVQHYTGAHGSMLRVFGWSGFTFEELVPPLAVAAPSGFTLKDVDGDGRIEVATVQADYNRPDPDNPEATLPYAAGAGIEQLYRLEGPEWVLVGERLLALPVQENGEWKLPEKHWHTDPPTIACPSSTRTEGRSDRSPDVSVSGQGEHRRINRPEYWKHQLRREEGELRLVIEEDGIENVVARLAPLERFAFVTAYVMRKLADEKALTVDVTESTLAVRRFACTREPPPRKWFPVRNVGSEVWRQPIEHHYDLDQPGAHTIQFREVCNYLIHHFAFVARCRGDHPELLFNSDATKDRLYSVVLDDYRYLVSEVISDEVRWVDMDRSTDTVSQRRTHPPDWP